MIAPHCDDETLGCGGTLLRHIAEGDSVHWLVVTSATKHAGFSDEAVARDARQIAHVSAAFGFAATHNLALRPSFLDAMPMSDVVSALKAVLKELSPSTLYIPHAGDAHSDHAIVARAAMSCAKWFRTPSIRRVLAYETISETEFGAARENPFYADVFVDVSRFLNRKIEIMRECYASEMGAFPFPRSEDSIRALAVLHGSTSGFHAAEAFMLLRELR